jgi:hypothetical protein
MQPRDDDIVLVVPFGARRTGRLRLPPEVGLWLYSQLREALALPRPECRKPRRRVKLKRGKWAS